MRVPSGENSGAQPTRPSDVRPRPSAPIVYSVPSHAYPPLEGTYVDEQAASASLSTSRDPSGDHDGTSPVVTYRVSPVTSDMTKMAVQFILKQLPKGRGSRPTYAISVPSGDQAG